MNRWRTFPTRRELRDVSKLAIPIVGVQVGIMLMGVVDAAMLGRVSPAALAAGALGNFYWMLVTMLGQGAVQALDPVIAQALGARDDQGIRLGIQRGTVVAVALSVPAMLMLVPAAWVLQKLSQPTDVAVLAGEYARACIPGVLAYYAFLVLRQTKQAFSRVGPIVWTIIAANLLNLFLDWVLIFGNLGAPRLEVVGSAWATTIGRWFMFGMLGVLSWPVLRPYARGSWRAALNLKALGQMLRIGIPIGIHQWLEIAAFGGALILMGHFGIVPLAAHQITITIVALTYMVPLGISAAAAVLVGQAIGRGDMLGARREAGAALVLGVGFMVLSALTLLIAPHTLARLFSDDAPVVQLAGLLLPIAAAFQVFDGIQGVASGVLRGAGDTAVPMVINLFGFVVIGLPSAWWLAHNTALGAQGVWWGLVAALVIVSLLLMRRVGSQMRKVITRVVVDQAPQ